MNRWRLFSVLLLLVLFLQLQGIKSVFAQTETPVPPVPTSTFYPLFPTRTSIPTRDLSCPDGNPIGWGSVTPNPAWYINCSGCIGYPTSTVTLNPLTPTVTPTLGGDEWYLYYGNSGLSGIFDADDNSLIWQRWVGDYANVSCPGGDIRRAIHLIMSYMVINSSSSGTVDIGINDYADSTPYMRVESTGIGVGTFYYTNKKQFAYVGPTSQAKFYELYGSTITGYTLSTLDDNNNDYKMYMGVNNPDYMTGVLEEVVTLCYGSHKPVIPTPTPIIDSYCDEVQDANEEEGLGVDLPSVLRGDGSLVGFGGQSWDLGWLENVGEVLGLDLPSTLSIPYFGFNFIPIIIGDMSLFGVNIPLNLMLVLMAGVSAFRIFTRS